MNLKELLEKGQGQTLEICQVFPANTELAKVISAFSNSNGGLILIGANPQTKEILGLKPEQIFEYEDLCKDTINTLVTPNPYIQTKVLYCDEKRLFAIEVLPGNTKPYYLKARDQFSGTYIRIGANNFPAKPSVLAELERQTTGVSYENEPVHDAVVEDLDKDIIETYLNARTELFNAPKVLPNYAFLEKAKFITRERGKIYPTVAGVLCFSPKATDSFPKAKIQCKIYEYRDKSKIVDYKVFSGLLYAQINAVESYFKGFDIPLEVIKELTLNAILHRDYCNAQEDIVISMFSDRVEVSTPSYLPFGMSVEELNDGVCIRRNPILYRVLKTLYKDFDEISGIQRANKILSEHEMAPVKFYESESNLITTVYADPVEDFISKEEQKVLDYLSTNDYVTNSQCQKILKMKGKQVQYVLTKLVKKGRILAFGEKKGRKYALVVK